MKSCFSFAPSFNTHNNKLNHKKQKKMRNEILVLETSIIELKNHYTIEGTIEKEWDMKKPIMKKVIYGTEIQKPTAYRIYRHANGSRRTWVFGELEINPDRRRVNQIKK